MKKLKKDKNFNPENDFFQDGKKRRRLKPLDKQKYRLIATEDDYSRFTT